jgi:dienelactone hydrolase
VTLSACGGAHHGGVQATTIRGVPAYVVTPASGGRHPVVILVHGSGGDRNELLPKAKELAKLGIVAVTITEPSTTTLRRATTMTQLLVASRESAQADVAAVRDVADALVARHDVDRGRLGYLGWSAGAKTGALVAAADTRFRALALLSAGAAPVSAFVAAAPPSIRAEARRQLTPVDPIDALERVHGAYILLEDGRRDEIVPRIALSAVVRAAPPGTTVRWYAAGHALTPKAYRDAETWLAERLTASARP